MAVASPQLFPTVLQHRQYAETPYINFCFYGNDPTSFVRILHDKTSNNVYEHMLDYEVTNIKKNKDPVKWKLEIEETFRRKWRSYALAMIENYLHTKSKLRDLYLTFYDPTDVRDLFIKAILEHRDDICVIAKSWTGTGIDMLPTLGIFGKHSNRIRMDVFIAVLFNYPEVKLPNPGRGVYRKLCGNKCCVNPKHLVIQEKGKRPSSSSSSSEKSVKIARISDYFIDTKTV